MDTDDKQRFLLLKNRLDLVAKNTTVETVAELQKFIRDHCSSRFLQPINIFVLFPFRFIISNNVPEAAKTTSVSFERLLSQVLDCLNELLKKICISKLEAIEEFLTMFTLFLDDDIKAGMADLSFAFAPKVAPLTEDLYLKFYDCLANLIHSIDQQEYLGLFESEQFQLKIGYLINTLLKVIKNHSFYKLRAGGFDLISKIFLKLLPESFEDFDYKISNFSNLKQASTFIGFSLPSIVSSIMNVLKLCSNQDFGRVHPTVIISGLKLLSIINQTVFWSQQCFPEEDPKDQGCDRSLKISMNEKWFKQTCTRLVPILATITEYLLQHPDSSVQYSLFQLSTNSLLNCCNVFVMKIIRIALKVPLFFYSIGCNDGIFLPDDQTNTSMFRMSQKFIDNFHTEISKKFSEDSSLTIDLTNLLHEEFYEQIRKIPYLVRNINSPLSSQLIGNQINNQESLAGALRLYIGFLKTLNRDGFYNFIKLEQHKYLQFRTLINVAQFNFAPGRLSFNLIEYQDFKSESFDPNPVMAKELFSIFNLEKQLIYLNEDTALWTYFSSIVQLVECCNLQSLEIILDHLTCLLRTSEFDPSTMLVTNAVICGALQLDYSVESQLVEIVNLYTLRLNIIDLYAMHDLTNELPKKSMKATSILRITSDDGSDSGRSKSAELNKKILQHCLAMQGLALFYSMAQVEPNKFYRIFFCRFLESFAASYSFVSLVAQKSLIFIGQKHFPAVKPDQVIYRMILDNLDYLYSSFSVTLDYAVVHRNETKLNSFVIDYYPLKTTQVALRVIFGLLLNYHQHVRPLIEEQLDRFHHLIDQIIHVIKYYSTSPNQNYSSNINSLLLVLHSYLQLLEGVFDHKNSAEAKSIQLNKSDSLFDDTIESLVEYTENCLFLINQRNEDFDYKDDEEEPNLEKAEESILKPPEEEDILEAPIINSRAGTILYTCSLLLADNDIRVRTNVLELASGSMRLLRSYDDVLLPYVHKLWDPLVNRFSADFDQPVILKRAFDCLMIASEFCGSFLLGRTKKDVLPRLVEFLNCRLDGRAKYFKQHQRMDQIKSVEYYAEYELLRSLGRLVCNLKMLSRDIWKVIDILLAYICFKGVSFELQQCAFESLATISTKVDCSSVYFYLHRILCLYYEEKEKIVRSCECKTTHEFGFKDYLLNHPSVLMEGLWPEDFRS